MLRPLALLSVAALGLSAGASGAAKSVVVILLAAARALSSALFGPV